LITQINRTDLKKLMGKGSGKAATDNRPNQMNPNSTAYAGSRSSTKAATDNRASQLNPNSEAYRSSRDPAQPSEHWKNEYPGAWIDPMTEINEEAYKLQGHEQC
jgi:hypothetical protein